MLCPMCSGESKVINSRPSEDSVYRRRECLECSHRFSTVEIDMELYDRMAPPDRDALRCSVDACLADLKQSIYQAYRL
jgi:transcriptional regulator NrdR family protein